MARPGPWLLMPCGLWELIPQSGRSVPREKVLAAPHVEGTHERYKQQVYFQQTLSKGMSDRYLARCSIVTRHGQTVHLGGGLEVLQQLGALLVAIFRCRIAQNGGGVLHYFYFVLDRSRGGYFLRLITIELCDPSAACAPARWMLPRKFRMSGSTVRRPLPSRMLLIVLRLRYGEEFMQSLLGA